MSRNLVKYDSDFLFQNHTIHHLLAKGLDRSKFILGIPFYGQTFTIASDEQPKLGVKATGAGSPGSYTNTAGLLSYFEVCF